MLVQADPVTRVIAKTYAQDREAGEMLLTLGLYEALNDEVDRVLPVFQRDLSREVSKINLQARRTLVRDYIAKRAVGEDTSDIARAAEYLTVVDVAFAKDSGDNEQTPYYDARDARGRFTRALAVLAGRDLQSLNRDKRGAAQRQVMTGAETGGKGALQFVQGDRYERARTLGRGLMLSSDPNINAVGMAAQVAGSLGQEAERVLTPGLQRTAYRYRGTERPADPAVKRAVKTASNYASLLSSDGETTIETTRAGSTLASRPRLQAGDQRKVDALRDQLDEMPEGPGRAKLERELASFGTNLAAEPVKERKTVSVADQARADLLEQSGARAGTNRVGSGVRRGGDPGVSVARYYSDADMTPDQLALAMRGDAAAAYLRTKLPSPEQTRISIAAGKMPPSQGVIIDADGDVVSEAMGYNGDHFLPFDLKNLKRLQGGQYVRTRARGGPTTEDVYTGLLSGARQVQVVSHSGVFTLEFDPSLRGGRRYGDKARQMIGRYGKLLDTIDAGGLYQHDLKPAEVRALRQQAYDQANGNAKDAGTFATILLDAARAKATFAGFSEDDVEDEAADQLRQLVANNHPAVRGLSRSAQERYREEVIVPEVREHHRQDEVKAYRLDGEGYEAAMKSLKEEFPYFIRDARFEPLPQFLSGRQLYGPGEGPLPPGGRGPDKGYTPPGNNHARSTDRGREGYYATDARTAAAPTAVPKKTTSSADEGTDKAKTTAAAAAAIAQATGNRSPEFADALDPKHVQRRQTVNLQMSNVIGAIDGLFQAPTKEALQAGPDEVGGLGDEAARMHWLMAHAKGSAARAVDFIAREAKPEISQQFIHDLRHLEQGPIASAPGYEADSPRAKRVFEQAKQLADTLELARPWREGEHATLEMPITPEDPRPLKFGDIAALKTDRQAYQNYARQDGVGKYIEAWKDAAPSKMAEEINAQLEKVIETADIVSGAIDGPGPFSPLKGTPVEQIKASEQTYRRDLEAMHKAYAWHHGKRLTEAYERLVAGKELDGPPFFPAAPAPRPAPLSEPLTGQPEPELVRRRPNDPPTTVFSHRDPEAAQRDLLVAEVAKMLGARQYPRLRRRLPTR